MPTTRDLVDQQERIVEKLQRGMLSLMDLKGYDPEELKTLSQALSVQIDKLMTLKTL